MYWGVTALSLLGHLEDMDSHNILQWVLSCQKEDGGFGGSPRHDSHLLYTLSAVQILALYDKMPLVDAARISSCVFPLLINYLKRVPLCAFSEETWHEAWTFLPICPGTQLDGARAFAVVLPRQICRCFLQYVFRPSHSLMHADVANLQQEDGSFCGDRWGEIDTRSRLKRSDLALQMTPVQHKHAIAVACSISHQSSACHN